MLSQAVEVGLYKHRKNHAKIKNGKGCYLPATINPDLHFHPDYLDESAWFIQNYYQRESFIKRKDGDSSYITLSSAILKKRLGDKYKAVVDFMLSNVFETDNHFELGRKCKGYRLKEEFRTYETETYEYKRKYFAKKNKKLKEDEVKNLPEHLKISRKILMDIDQDTDAALKFLERKYPNRNTDKDEQKAWQRLDTFIKNIDDPESRPFLLSEHTGRLYTWLTSYPRDMRQFVSYKGVKLTNIDIANSQPLLIPVLIKAILLDIQDNSDNNKYISQYSYNLVKDFIKNKDFFYVKNNYLKTNNEESLIGSTFPTFDSIFEEILRFQKLCEEGLFYEHFMEAINWKGSRDDFKGRYYVVVYGKNFYKGKLKDAIAKEFPLISHIIHLLKQEDYRLFPVQLSRIEADIVIQNVAKNLIEKYNLPLVTIHDSIAIPANYDTQIVLDEFINCYAKHGVKPKLSIENFG